MVGYQASGAAPFVRGAPVAAPETIASAIRIGNPQSFDFAVAAARESGGWFDAHSDESILEAQAVLAEREGIFCEPASAVCVAGMMRDLESGRLPEGSTVVCTLTGHGLKDPDVAVERTSAPVAAVKPEAAAVKALLLEHLR